MTIKHFIEAHPNALIYPNCKTLIDPNWEILITDLMEEISMQPVGITQLIQQFLRRFPITFEEKDIWYWEMQLKELYGTLEPVKLTENYKLVHFKDLNQVDRYFICIEKNNVINQHEIQKFEFTGLQSADELHKKKILNEVLDFYRLLETEKG